jgi:hypothetical protein
MTPSPAQLSPLEQQLSQTAERLRLLDNAERRQYWQRWGPYLSDRQWGTVREDYSANGTAWEDFSHDQARSRAYRWGEDGILGISDSSQQLCFALALWNGRDPILKERFFGLTGNQGNHGEDVKEYYFYLDSTPTHSYMRGLYKYPMEAYPYKDLVDENQRRGRGAFEYELLDTGVFEGGHYYDVEIEYAKASPEDIAIRIHVSNRSPSREGTLHLLPTLWFRNIWSWKRDAGARPQLRWQQEVSGRSQIRAEFRNQGQIDAWGFQPAYTLLADAADTVLVTDNDTNLERFQWGSNPSPHVKDAFHSYLINHNDAAVNPAGIGTKAAPCYKLTLQPGETRTLRLRLRGHSLDESPFSSADPIGAELDQLVAQRLQEADDFYACITPLQFLNEDQRLIQRQAFAGMLWSKQFYHLIIKDWLNGDDAQPPPPAQRKQGRNSAWIHLYNEDIVSMPDKWEYPWYAAWDLAFHTIPLALIDPDFAKKQLQLFAREWFMHPNGQLPAYEWNFEDVNPPVHAWASFRVYQIEKRKYGKGDVAFLEEIFSKMTIYFTWWVNRKGIDGDNLFSGGFLGLDNIAVFDRSNFNVCNDRGECAQIIQSDGSSWMAMFCLNMLKIASELAKDCDDDERSKSYDNMASKFLQHFLLIADAINLLDEKAGGEAKIFDDEDQFYYDILKCPAGVVEGDGRPQSFSMKVRSLVGLIPMLAVEAIPKDLLENALSGDFGKRLTWFSEHTSLTSQPYVYADREGLTGRFKGGLLLSLVNQDRLRGLLRRMLDEEEFLSPHGIRSLSKVHADPYHLPVRLRRFDRQSNQWNDFGDVSIRYTPAESDTGLFGGNSNWRGPVWFPINYLLIESLQKLYMYLGPEFTVPCPSGSGADREVRDMNLRDVSQELSRRLISLFEQRPQPDQPDTGPMRPVYGGTRPFQQDPYWQNHVLFFEYFHGDNGAGLGASHQTGWTGLVAKLIEQHARFQDPSESVFLHANAGESAGQPVQPAQP